MSRNSILPICLAAGLLVGGCASPPEHLRGDYAGPAPGAAEPGDVGARVRWGGQLLAVRPQNERTCFEILSRPLNAIARPRPADTTAAGSRFLACQRDFADPAAYRDSAAITVAGELEDFESRTIGEYEYRYPVVELGAVHVWPDRVEAARAPPPPLWWYSPYGRYPGGVGVHHPPASLRAFPWSAPWEPHEVREKSRSVR